MAKVTQEAEIKGEQLQPTFSITRYCYMGYYRAYYPFGNTPAEDYLEHCASTPNPSILALGCGDLRSCFYTLWKNFDFTVSTAPKRFDSMNITFNDNSAAILARNVMFLYMCVNLPEESKDRAKWLCAMWAIWYCHELYPYHLEVLESSLTTLLSFSESPDVWSKKENPLHSLVSFASANCLSEVSQMWKMWLHKAFIDVPSKQTMHEARDELLHQKIRSKHEHSLNLSRGHTLIFGDPEVVSTQKATARAPEVKSYLDYGSCYAEHVMSLDLPPKTQIKVNLTMYERPDGRYTCHYGLVPFECYFQTVEFSPQYLKSRGRTIPYDVTLPTKSFASKPFLSNSFQQFLMWIQSSYKTLKEVKISFIFDSHDAIVFCQHQDLLNSCSGKDSIPKHKYEIINTSNLMDHLGSSNLILACMPLLQDQGVVTTLSLCCKSCTNTGDELLSLLFGFSSNLLPVLLGVRCISHEGMDYSNSTNIKPSAPDISHFLKCLPHVRIFLWVKELSAQELIFNVLPPVQDGNVTEALVNMLGMCTYALLNHGPGESKGVLSRNSAETALSMLKRFEGLSGQSKSYSYWKPLCTALKRFASPYLHCLQTQFLLHGVHAHLTFSDDRCPICSETDLKEMLGLFCFRIKLNSINYGTPCFMAYVHRGFSTDPEVLQKEALKGGDVHIFDCFDDACTQKDLQLKFFSPLEFAQKKYWTLLVYVQRTNTRNILEPIMSIPLEDIQVSWTDYAFYQAEQKLKPCSKSSFGSVTFHTCDSVKSETEISLSEKTLNALSSNKLTTNRVSSREFMLECGSLQLSLCISYPINYNSIKINLSKSKGSLSITCQRQRYNLEDERPCFIVSPDHRLSILSSSLDSSYISKHSQMQLTREEAKLIQSPYTAHLCSADTEFRRFLQILFECALRDSYFRITSNHTSCCCLITINEVLFDYNNKTPAIDLAYCFTDEYGSTSLKFYMIVGDSYMQTLPVNEAEMKTLKNTLKYFSLRTNGTLRSACSSSRLSSLVKSKIDHEFTRAVVYFLLCDPDVKLYAFGDFFGFTTANFMPKVGGTSCAHCKRLTFTAKLCGQCGKTSYCSKKCQMNDWSKHKHQCSSGKDAHQFKCSFCGATLNTSQNEIKKPSCMCKNVQYCSNDCMVKDEPNHFKCCKGSKTKSPNNGDVFSKSDLDLPKCTYCNAILFWSKKCSETSCEALYCNIDCKNKDWPSHKSICKKQLDSSNSDIAQPKCSFCNRSSSHLKKCTRCGKVLYCDQTCQRNHWPQHCKSCSTHQEFKEGKNQMSTHEGCSFCGKMSVHHLKRCTGCKTAQYCDSDCQSKDWPIHKVTCVNPMKALESVTTVDVSQLCSYCNRKSCDLKKCSKCKKVQYCNRSCQEKDWPNHKNSCSGTANEQDSSRHPSSTPMPRCSYCLKSIANVVKCPQCNTEHYCSLYCQQKHLSVHKLSCNYVTKSKHEATPSCASCGSTSVQLFACKRCGKVKYCGKKCQVTDWKNHKTNCIKN